ncbi:50S ribosomal protein L6 [Candidatus Curtissbacteria bacterium]|nr:50S ribosomal protein L6 [Candidatus Curtissbacteria bacterium]
MSKIGKQPVQIQQGVIVSIVEGRVSVSGPKGELTITARPEVKVQVKEDKVTVTRKNETKFAKSLHGMTRSVIANMVKGVTVGHEKTLELVGVGYRAAKEGGNLVLSVGYSHPVVITEAPGIEIETKENKIIVSGADKILVGETAARIRRVRPPEPYKGKGIKYAGEFIRRKAGKTVKAVGAA